MGSVHRNRTQEHHAVVSSVTQVDDSESKLAEHQVKMHGRHVCSSIDCASITYDDLLVDRHDLSERLETIFLGHDVLKDVALKAVWLDQSRPDA